MRAKIAPVRSARAHSSSSRASKYPCDQTRRGRTLSPCSGASAPSCRWRSCLRAPARTPPARGASARPHSCRSGSRGRAASEGCPIAIATWRRESRASSTQTSASLPRPTTTSPCSGSGMVQVPVSVTMRSERCPAVLSILSRHERRNPEGRVSTALQKIPMHPSHVGSNSTMTWPRGTLGRRQLLPENRASYGAPA